MGAKQKSTQDSRAPAPMLSGDERETDANAAAHYRQRAFDAAADGFTDAARSFSVLADLAQLRAEAGFR